MSLMDFQSAFPINTIMHMFIMSSDDRQYRQQARRLLHSTVLNAQHYCGAAVMKLLELKENACARTLMEITYRLPGGTLAEKRELIMHFNTHETDDY
jgi:hypothetical protein